MTTTSQFYLVSVISIFVIRICLGFRISCFGFGCFPHQYFAFAFSLALAIGNPAIVLRADQSREEPFSGPQVGERLTALNVERVYGPAEGVQLDFAKFAADGDSMVIFVSGASRPAAELTRALINYAEMQPRNKLFAAIVWLDNDRSAACYELSSPLDHGT